MSDVCSMMRDCVVVDVYTSSDVQFIIIIIAAGGANAPAYWAPASLIRPTPKKTPVA